MKYRNDIQVKFFVRIWGNNIYQFPISLDPNALIEMGKEEAKQHVKECIENVSEKIKKQKEEIVEEIFEETETTFTVDGNKNIIKKAPVINFN